MRGPHEHLPDRRRDKRNIDRRDRTACEACSRRNAERQPAEDTDSDENRFATEPVGDRRRNWRTIAAGTIRATPTRPTAAAPPCRKAITPRASVAAHSPVQLAANAT